MTSRFLAAFLMTVAAIGQAADAWSQTAGTATSRQRKADDTSSAGAKTPDGEDGATGVAPTSFDSPTDLSQPKDPFDAAEAKAKSAGSLGNGSKSKSADDTMVTAPKLEKATFGAGCFWHVEAEFEWLPGVKSAISGYSGGNVANPSYEMVHEGDTGHAEVVQVEYDPSVITYEQLLKVFWNGHNPTEWNRQGPDEGPQYRSVIFYHNEDQRKAALRSYRELTASRRYRAPIVTQLMPMKAFYRAEEYHQNYYGGRSDRVTARPSRSRRTAKAATAKGTTAAATAKVAKKKGTAVKSAEAQTAESKPATGAAGANAEP
jgi:peptide-methionine (S)-S-oxide reductase